MKGQTRGAEFARRTVRHQIYVERYSVAVVRKMLALLDRTDAEITAKIKAIEPGTDAYAKQRFEATLQSIDELNARVTRDLSVQLAGNVTQFGAYEGAFTAKLASDTFGVQWQGPSLEQLRAAAMSRPFQNVHLAFAKLDDHVDEFGRRRGAMVRDTLRRGFLQGDSVDDMVKRVRGTRSLGYKDGLMDVSRRTAETIVRTAVSHTATAAREEVYKVNDSLIKGVQWVSVIDARTSSICRSYDGQIFDTDKGPRPPAHPNCRSTTIPVIKGEKPVERISYSEWLNTQDKGVVEDVLGVKKAALFLDGNLPLDRFTNNDGKEYTLDQLQQRDASAFKKAGLNNDA